MSDNKSIKINFMKIITMFFVVIGHCTRMYTSVSAISTIPNNYMLTLITKFIYGFHMPLFFLISGFIFSICIVNGKYKDKIKFIKNKFLRLVIPYLFFGVFYVTPIIIMLKLTNYSYIKFVFNNILFMKDSRHLWFLPVLFSIFLISIFIKPNKNKMKNILFLIVSFIISIFAAKLNLFFISNILEYIFYFYLGYILNYYYENYTEKKSLFFGLVFLIIYILLQVFDICHFFYGLIGSLALFLILNSINIDKISRSKMFSILDKYNMGIYLFHPMIIYILFSIPYVENFNPFLNCIFIIIVSYILSIVFSKILVILRLDFALGESK